MKPREIEPLFVAAIDCDERKREVRDDAVKALAESMERVGLRTPITVRPVNDGERLVLVAGAHRLAAAKLLGWERIDAFLEDECDEIDAELWEIAENLHRAELTALERDEQVARWIELSGHKVAQSGPVSQGGRGKTGGLRKALRDLEQDHGVAVKRTEAQRATKVASLSEQAKVTAREVGLDDNRTALLEASRKASAVEQVEFLKAQAERKAKERANREVDRAISLTEAEQFAGWLAERIAPTERDTLISWLEGTKAKDVIAALRRHHS